jgi:hypothetical protein
LACGGSSSAHTSADRPVDRPSDPLAERRGRKVGYVHRRGYDPTLADVTAGQARLRGGERRSKGLAQAALEGVPVA